SWTARSVAACACAATTSYRQITTTSAQLVPQMITPREVGLANFRSALWLPRASWGHTRRVRSGPYVRYVRRLVQGHVRYPWPTVRHGPRLPRLPVGAVRR